jgi:hypothetical protein
MKNSEICDVTETALNVLRNHFQVYLQAIIFVLRAGLIAPTEDRLHQTYNTLGEYTRRMGMNQEDYFHGNLFYTQISGLENFFQTVLSVVVKTYPQKIGSTQFTLSQIAEVGSIDTLTELAAEAFLNRLMYKKPFDYMNELCETLSVNKAKILPLWPLFIEAKARRDIGIHNNWICNDTYLRKVREAGLVSHHRAGDLLVPTTDDYRNSATNAMMSIADTITQGIFDTYGKQS